MTAQLIPLTRPDKANEAGIPVDTVDQLRWMERTADEKGLRAAFVRIGRRVFIDPAKFHELVRQEPTEQPASDAVNPREIPRRQPESARQQRRSTDRRRSA